MGFEPAVFGSALAEFFCTVFQPLNQFGRSHHRAHPAVGLAGMSLMPGDGGGQGNNALVGGDDFHLGRFPDNHRPGFGQVFLQFRNHPGSSETADFLIVGEREVDRFFQVFHFRDQ